MELLVKRRPTKIDTTFGQLSVDGKDFCFTLEDVVREIHGQSVDKWKINSKTAIPEGRYRVTFEDSPKFGPDTLTVNDVPGFVAIRIHSGNDDADTEGCLLVGESIAEDNVDGGNILQSRAALARLKAVVMAAINGRSEEAWITYHNAPAGC